MSISIALIFVKNPTYHHKEYKTMYKILMFFHLQFFKRPMNFFLYNVRHM